MIMTACLPAYIEVLQAVTTYIFFILRNDSEGVSGVVCVVSNSESYRARVTKVCVLIGVLVVNKTLVVYSMMYIQLSMIIIWRVYCSTLVYCIVPVLVPCIIIRLTI